MKTIKVIKVRFYGLASLEGREYVLLQSYLHPIELFFCQLSASFSVVAFSTKLSSETLHFSYCSNLLVLSTRFFFSFGSQHSGWKIQTLEITFDVFSTDVALQKVEKPGKYVPISSGLGSIRDTYARF